MHPRLICNASSSTIHSLLFKSRMSRFHQASIHTRLDFAHRCRFGPCIDVPKMGCGVVSCLGKDSLWYLAYNMVQVKTWCIALYSISYAHALSCTPTPTLSLVFLVLPALLITPSLNHSLTHSLTLSITSRIHKTPLLASQCQVAGNASHVAASCHSIPFHHYAVLKTLLAGSGLVS